jgi:hypothetical protein
MIIEKLEWRVPLWRRLLLFQSPSQVFSALVCYALFFGSLSIASVIFHKGIINAGMIIVPVAFSLYPVYTALPTGFVIRGNGAGRSIPFLSERLKFMGYKVAAVAPHRSEYMSRLPRFLSWRENRFLIDQADNVVNVQGPRLATTVLRSALCKHYRLSE